MYEQDVLYQIVVFVLVPLVVLSLCLGGLSLFLIAYLVRTLSGRNGVISESLHTSEGLNADIGAGMNADVNAAASAGGGTGVQQEYIFDQVSPTDTAQMFTQRALAAGMTHGLTRREIEVLELLLQGRNAERVSQSLVISRHTAKTHMYNIYRKTGTSSQQDLIDLIQGRATLSEKGVAYGSRTFTHELRAS